MKGRILRTSLMGQAFVLVLGICTGFQLNAQTYRSPRDVAVAAGGKMLVVAQETANKIALLDVGSGAVAKEVAVPGPATGVCVDKSGMKAYVTCGLPNGRVVVVDLGTGAISSTIMVGHTPLSPVLSPDGKTLYVCNRFDNHVSVVDLSSGKETGRVVVPREPIAAAVSNDGSTLFVANHLPATAADGAYVTAVISIIDLGQKKVEKNIQLPNGSTGLRGLCISPDGKNVYATHILARYQLPTTQLERGWMNTNALTVVDVAGKKLVNTCLLDTIDRGAANPWAVAVSADNKYVCVTHAGTHELSVIDRDAMHKKLADAEAGKRVTEVTSSKDDVPNDLAFLVGIRRRLKLEGNGPRSVALIGNDAYTGMYYTDDVCKINIDPKAAPKPKAVALGKKQPMTPARKGEMFFNDASMCFQQWQSCASCHPDARTDGLNWDLLNDGIGNPKQSKSMLLTHKTPPVMVSGVRGKAEIAVRAGIRFIQFAVRPDEDAQAIDAYLMSMKPVPSPYLIEGKLSESAQRGKKIFQSAGCADCHPAPLYTSLGSADVGTGEGRERGKAWDTPTCVEVWRTAPYLYRGQAATMEEVFTKYNKNNEHGDTKNLSKKELQDLINYVLSL